MTARVLPRRKNFPTHGPWDRDGSVPGHRKWSGCKKNGMQGVQRCMEGCTGVHGAQGARLARVGAHVCAKVGMVEIGCGGYLGGAPPIGKLEPLGLISGEMVLQDGWQGQMDMSKCRNAAGFGHVHVHMHGVLEGDGRWWWALNGCTNQPEGWPLGPVVGQTAPGAGMAGMDGQVQMWCDLARDGGGHVCASKTLLGVAGEGWGASNECASLPKEGPRGPGLKHGPSRVRVTKRATASKCSDVA